MPSKTDLKCLIPSLIKSHNYKIVNDWNEWIHTHFHIFMNMNDWKLLYSTNLSTTKQQIEIGKKTTIY